MIDLRKALLAKLKTVHSRVYYSDSVPKSAKFPYLVYDLPNDNGDGESMELIVVDIDGWDNTADTTSLETLMASVNSALNKAVLAMENSSVVLYLDIKLSLKDDDPRIKRRKYTYQAKLFRRG